MSERTSAAIFEPFFIPGRFPLYACLSRARPPVRNTSVILCSAWGDEYLRFHRALRQLALLLTDAGFHVLRFDWSGCGDSGGTPNDWSLERWRQDLLLVAAALQQPVGPCSLAVSGLRLGASVAAAAAPALPDLRALLLWDPVVDGSAYVQEMRHLQRIMLGRAHALTAPPGRQASGEMEESLGFPLPARWLQELKALRLALPAFPGKRLWINTRPDSGQSLPDPGAARVDLIDLPFPELWIWQEAMAHTLVPRAALERIVSWLSEACP